MKVSFPHMGNYYPAFKSLMENLGCEVLVPPSTSRKTMELGARYAPEFSCLPFKINLGNYIEALDLGADVVKTEIIAHAVAAQYFNPDVRTVIEIGGQDSKIILLRNGVVVDFAMNSICAAGCGAFLDYQARRLKMPIETFGAFALKSKSAVNIAGRCTVFAESDMVHKQQIGQPLENIICGLCKAIVRNYLNNVGKGKKISSPVVFQGGVAANQCEVVVIEQEKEVIARWGSRCGKWNI